MPSQHRRRAAPAPRVPGTTRIVLHGALRKEFGGPVDWGCPTPASAIYALCVNKPGFREALVRGRYRVIRGPRVNGVHLDERMLRIKFNPEQAEFHIIPVAAGAKSSGGLIKIVLGVVLIAAAIATAGGAFAGAPGFASASAAGAAGVGGSGGAITGALGLTLGNSLFGVTAGAMALFGASMILGGIGDILARNIKPPAQNASFLLSGPTNTTVDGGPVPLAYGTKIRVGSVVISSGYEAVAYNATSSVDYGGTGNSGGSFDDVGDLRTFTS